MNFRSRSLKQKMNKQRIPKQADRNYCCYKFFMLRYCAQAKGLRLPHLCHCNITMESHY